MFIIELFGDDTNFGHIVLLAQDLYYQISFVL